jgi:uncharacterized protein (TIGR02118 family)
MYKAVLLYHQPENPEAFEQHHLGRHLSLTARVPNVVRIETARALPASDGSPAPFYRTAEMWFDDLLTLRTSLGSPEGREALADTESIATGGVDVFITEID